MPKNTYRGRGNPRRIVQSQDDEVPGNAKHFSNNDNRGMKNKFRGGNIKSGRIDRHRRTDPTRLKQMVEQDVDMGGTGSSSADSHRRGGYSRHDRRSHQQAPISNHSLGDAEWKKVTISHGTKYDKEFILKTLLNATKIPFLPICFQQEGRNFVFYLEDTAAAEALRSLSSQITLHDGFKIILFVKGARPPTLPLNDELKGKLKSVMSRRYNAVTKTLDLSKFYCDEEICINYYAPLARENVCRAVVNIIADNIPDVESIDFSGNKIHNMEAMRDLKTKAPQLKLLNMANNKISQITSLDCLEGLPLKGLILNQNPVCDRFTDQATYVSAVRKRFQKLTHLDGVELPPVISFDIEADDATIPPTGLSWFASAGSQAIVSTFLQQYISVYDSDDRQPLVDAYHDGAVMSLTCSNLPGQHADRSSRLDPYMKENRNLRRVESSSHRFRLLHKGKVDIVSQLSKLPKTTHDPTSLVVDVPVASNVLIVASITGIFKERAERQLTLRWFERVMVIIPNANGFCITNEQFHITNATAEQAKRAFKDVSAPVPVPETPQASVGAANDPSIEVLRTQMVLSFSEQSGMNLEWSRKCLEENEWDFDRAAFVFGQLQANNQIPPEAFRK